MVLKSQNLISGNNSGSSWVTQNLQFSFMLWQPEMGNPKNWHLQYCAKVMRAKCANFVLCLRVFSKKIRPKIRASFRNVLNVISLKQRSKIRRIFETRTKIPYQRNNCACGMRNIAVQWADQYRTNNVPFSCEQSRSRWRFTPRCCLCVNSSFMAKNFNPLIVFSDTNSQT